jgi:hypothetical protein
MKWDDMGKATNLYPWLGVRINILDHLSTDSVEPSTTLAVPAGFTGFGGKSIHTCVYMVQDSEGHHIFLPDLLDLNDASRRWLGVAGIGAGATFSRWWKHLIRYAVEEGMPEMGGVADRPGPFPEEAGDVFLCLGDRHYPRKVGCGDEELLYRDEENVMKRAMGRGYRGYRRSLNGETRGLFDEWFNNNVGLYLQDFSGRLAIPLE